MEQYRFSVPLTRNGFMLKITNKAKPFSQFASSSPVQKRSTGMTLLEVLISITLLAIGMIGIASMLLISQKANNSNYTRQQAAQAIYDMFDKIRANSQTAISGNYNISNIGSNGMPTAVNTPAVLCNNAACNATQLATYDGWNWLTHNVAQLPNGSGSITTAAGPTGNTIVTITVQWDDSIAQQAMGATGNTAPTNNNFVQMSMQSAL